MTLHSGYGPTEARPYIVLTCEYPAGARVLVTLEQSLGAAGNAVGQMFDRTGCGPTPLRIHIPLSSDRGPEFRAGQATLTIEADGGP